MAILIKCPKCKHRMSQEAGTCECGLNIRKADGKPYWIEYRIDGRRKRERIGTSKLAAETRLQTVLKSRAEDRYIDRNKNTCWTLGELAAPWYLALARPAGFEPVTFGFVDRASELPNSSRLLNYLKLHDFALAGFGRFSTSWQVLE